MAESYTHFGQAKDHIWGADAVGADYGEVQRVRKAGTGAYKELHNRFGAKVGETRYDGAERYETTVLLKKGKAPPKNGAVITYKGTKYIVKGDVVEEQSNEDYQTLSFQMEVGENETL